LKQSDHSYQGSLPVIPEVFSLSRHSFSDGGSGIAHPVIPEVFSQGSRHYVFYYQKAYHVDVTSLAKEIPANTLPG